MIGEGRVDPEIHGFVSSIFPPLTGSAYEERPYAYNGGLAHPPLRYAARRSRGFPGGELIGEGRVDPEIHGFVSSIFPPLTGSAYEDAPYAYNGGLAHPPRAFASRRSQGFPGGELIGEGRVDPEIHGFVSSIFPPLTGSAYEDAPYAYNGGLAYPPRAFAEVEKADIGRDEVRPDVYEVVRKNIDPAPLPRMSRPYYFDPYDPSTREKIEYDFTEDSDAGRQHKKREELRLLLEAEAAIAKAKKAKRAQAEMARLMKKDQEE